MPFKNVLSLVPTGFYQILRDEWLWAFFTFLSAHCFHWGVVCQDVVSEYTRDERLLHFQAYCPA